MAARLLGILRDRQPGILALADHLGLDKSSVTGLIDRAERRDLVERIARPEDRRAIRVVLTRTGRSLATRFATEVDEELSAVTAGLTDAQRRQLTSLLSKVVLDDPEARPALSPEGLQDLRPGRSGGGRQTAVRRLS